MNDRGKLFLDRVKTAVDSVPLPRLVEAVRKLCNGGDSRMIGVAIVAWYNGTLVASSEQNYASIEKAFAALIPN